MSFGAGELNCMYGPVGNILFQDHFIPLDMETTNFGKYYSRIAIPWPSFELPCLKYGKKINSKLIKKNKMINALI